MSLVTKEKKLATGTTPGAVFLSPHGAPLLVSGLPNNGSDAVPAATWHKLSLAKLLPWF